MYATYHCAVFETKTMTRIKQAHVCTIDSDSNVASPVSRLLFTCGPSAIKRGITEFIVDPFNGMMASRLCAHIQ